MPFKPLINNNLRQLYNPFCGRLLRLRRPLKLLEKNGKFLMSRSQLPTASPLSRQCRQSLFCSQAGDVEIPPLLVFFS